MCLFKITGPDGATELCPCPRYIPNENPVPGPQKCRDCIHWESMHPPPEQPRKTAMADLMDSLRPRVGDIRSRDPADEEARKESYAGFRKVSGDSKPQGRGGATKYQKSEKRRSTQKKKEKTHRVGNIVFIPDADFPDDSEDSSDSDEDEDNDSDDKDKQHDVGAVPDLNKMEELKESLLVVTEDKEGNILEYSEDWSEEYIDQRWLKPLFSAAYKYMEGRKGFEEGDLIWVPLHAHRNRLRVFKKKGEVTGEDLEKIKAGKGKRVELSTLYLGKKHGRWATKTKGKDNSAELPRQAKSAGQQSSSKAKRKQEDDDVEIVESEDATVGAGSLKGKSVKKDSPLKIRIKREPARAKNIPTVSTGEPDVIVVKKEKLEPQTGVGVGVVSSGWRWVWLGGVRGREEVSSSVGRREGDLVKGKAPLSVPMIPGFFDGVVGSWDRELTNERVDELALPFTYTGRHLIYLTLGVIAFVRVGLFNGRPDFAFQHALRVCGFVPVILETLRALMDRTLRTDDSHLAAFARLLIASAGSRVWAPEFLREGFIPLTFGSGTLQHMTATRPNFATFLQGIIPSFLVFHSLLEQLRPCLATLSLDASPFFPDAESLTRWEITINLLKQRSDAFDRYNEEYPPYLYACNNVQSIGTVAIDKIVQFSHLGEMVGPENLHSTTLSVKHMINSQNINTVAQKSGHSSGTSYTSNASHTPSVSPWILDSSKFQWNTIRAIRLRQRSVRELPGRTGAVGGLHGLY
ncbi:hypothetical protein R3P38DRAFT_3244572 [Favolaschia claudopus]|uniref:Uncharacterized protein n=1 Tax=Favolaschia claudopus TaxID=2862362 RepID=A0AAV9Z1U8_9AGAR